MCTSMTGVADGVVKDRNPRAYRRRVGARGDAGLELEDDRDGLRGLRGDAAAHVGPGSC